ncbi:DUF4037 domain-containing protein [Ktedonosporobacter rubrisoli]|uniref:DUF4037 domain-containing protein n=1 Tax=Ktedonosporobacter rubrisoli TaxID=2509675 RepID=A0A4P6K5A7_KTERU|nr:DUF4037 domain-containing protein [Ktedonosporobacter rubrisoli]QBD83133.1 DUF4037 domain-containing protein [Ktedonosporobacter rubrisoli]
MHYASQWRADIASSIAPLIARNPHVGAIMIGGSTSRDRADSFSDIEIGVFWSRSPREEERLAPIEPAGGVFWELDPYDPEADTWMEEWGLNNLKMDIRNMTIDGVEQQLSRVLNNYETDLFLQQTLSAILHGIPLHGHDQLKRWQERLVHYPAELSEAMVRHYSGEELREWCWWVDQLLTRGDIPLVYHSFNDAIFQVISMLMGLNQIYHPGFKWLRYSLSELHILPSHLGERIDEVYTRHPRDGLKMIRSIVLETYDLIAEHLPQLGKEIDQARSNFLHQRQQFEQPPSLPFSLSPSQESAS